jgi:hypothetical protein
MKKRQSGQNRRENAELLPVEGPNIVNREEGPIRED